MHRQALNMFAAFVAVIAASAAAVLAASKSESDPVGSVTFSLAAPQNAPGINLMANETPAYVGDYTLVGTYSPATLPKDESTVKLIDDNTLSWTSLLDNTDRALAMLGINIHNVYRLLLTHCINPVVLLFNYNIPN